MESPIWLVLICKIPGFWGWKLWLDFVLFDSENINIYESKIYFFYQVENKFQNFQGNIMVYNDPEKCSILIF